MSRKPKPTPEPIEGQERREVRTEAKKVRKRNHILRILFVILLLLILLMSISYACVSFVNKAGRFTINLDPDAYNVGISISDTKDFKNPTIMLSGDPVENMDNITKEWILNHKSSSFHNPNDPTYATFADLDNVDGSHNGQNYIAYTFYIKNTGKEKCGYHASLDILSSTKGTDEAMRVMVYYNGEPTVYGKTPREDNKHDKYAWFEIDKTFKDAKTVMEISNRNFKVGDMDKYTVVLWLEGWDPECVNDILGGEAKLEMNFDAIKVDEKDV